VSAPRRILVVDDNREHRLLLRRYLQRLDAVEILEATDGQQALELAAREPVDVIIMDMAMPVLDGAEATRRIRALAGPARDVPIVAFTADTVLVDQSAARAAGCDVYVTKPVSSFRALRQLIEQLLLRRRAPA
jgi:CheY-like chemotaxis protein